MLATKQSALIIFSCERTNMLCLYMILDLTLTVLVTTIDALGHF